MQITDTVWMLDCSKFSHVFLIRGDTDVLIDTGMPWQSGAILDELSALGVPSESVKTILLTHHDVDHIGGARALKAATGAELYAPVTDIPFITGETKRPGTKRLTAALARVKPPSVTGGIADGQTFGEITAVHAPGHTPGHTMFLYRKVLFCGDLLRCMDGHLRRAPRFMHADLNAVDKSIALLKHLEFDWLCPSHSAPARWTGALKAELEAL